MSRAHLLIYKTTNYIKMSNFADKHLFQLPNHLPFFGHSLLKKER
jgi:hypothetical protein